MLQEDESVARASGVVSTSTREAVGLDACVQICLKAAALTDWDVMTDCAPT